MTVKHKLWYAALPIAVLTISALLTVGTAAASPTHLSQSHLSSQMTRQANLVRQANMIMKSSLHVAIPRTATNCNPNPLQSANECTTVVGTGTYVDSISGVTFSNVPYNITRVHIQIYRASDGHTFKNCSEFTLPGFGKGPVCLWVNPTPHVHVPAGDYCSKAWEFTGSGYVELSAECVNVHA
jgi:hypothetical protein